MNHTLTKEEEKGFEAFIDDNKNGGSSRWMVSPDTIKRFIVQIKSNAVKAERERIADLLSGIDLTQCEVEDLILSLNPQQTQ